MIKKVNGNVMDEVNGGMRFFMESKREKRFPKLDFFGDEDLFKEFLKTRNPGEIINNGGDTVRGYLAFSNNGRLYSPTPKFIRDLKAFCKDRNVEFIDEWPGYSSVGATSEEEKDFLKNDYPGLWALLNNQ